jgi:hypothetical protein
MSDPAAPGAPDNDVTGDGVFRVVLEGYDAVYDALARGETFNRLWRLNAYGGDFPEQFAHIGFLTAGGCRSCSRSSPARRWPTWPAAPEGRACGWPESRGRG